jgi:hypothetical protein
VIDASDLEDTVMIAIMMAACVTGSDLILKTNFMAMDGETKPEGATRVSAKPGRLRVQDGGQNR